MKYKEAYFDLKKGMLKLYKKHAFEKFNAMNFFYLADETSKGVVVFNNQGFEESLSIAIYYGTSGIHYLIDSYTSSTGYKQNDVAADMMVLTLFKRKYLAVEDLSYFKKHNLRVFEENNLIACEFKEGYRTSYLSISKLRECTKYIYFLLSLIDNELASMEEEFKEEKILLAGFDTTNYVYEITYGDAIPVSIPAMRKTDSSFVEEYKSATYLDDVCYIGRYFEPYQKEDTDYYESLFIAYYEKSGQRYMERIPCRPNQFLEYSTGFLDTLFKEYGIPTKIIFNHRKWMSYSYRTLKKLNVEVEFESEITFLEQILFEYFKEIIGKIEEGEKRLNVFVS